MKLSTSILALGFFIVGLVLFISYEMSNLLTMKFYNEFSKKISELPMEEVSQIDFIFSYSQRLAAQVAIVE